MHEAKGRRSPFGPAHGAGLSLFAICLLPFAIAVVTALAQDLVVGPDRNSYTPDNSSATQAASSRRGTSRIRGLVVDAETGRPVPFATITVMSPDLFGVTFSTGTDGRYETPGMAAGRYTVGAVKNGYVQTGFGQYGSRDRGKVVVVGERETVSGIDILLVKGGVLVAHVMDDVGDPVSGVLVSTDRFGRNGEDRWLLPAVARATETDDRGEVRLYGLTPSRYYVAAESRHSRAIGIGSTDDRRLHVRTYYPGTADIHTAQPVDVQPGQEVHVSFRLATARTSTIAGTVFKSDVSIPPAVSLKLLPVGFSSLGSASYTSPGHAGAFSWPGVVPGRYRLSAEVTERGSAVREFGSTFVDVGESDVSGLVIRTSPGSTIRGRIEFDTPRPPVDVAARQIKLSLSYTSGGSSTGLATVYSDWTFELKEVFGTGVVRLNSPRFGFHVRAVIIDGKDVAETPIDFNGDRDYTGARLILTRKQFEVSGEARNAAGQPVLDYAVVIFSEDRARWPFRGIGTTASDQNGRFSVTELLPGRYLAAAVTGFDREEQEDANFLETLRARATPIVIGESGLQGLVLTVMAR